MKKLALAALAVPAAALAQTYHLDKVTISGSQSMPTADLYGAIQEHAGTTVTKDQIVADQTAIGDALQKHHVVGAIKTLLVSKPGNHVEVRFVITDNGVQNPTTTTVAPVLGTQAFVGNKKVDTATLQTAAGLKAGDKLDQKTLTDAQARIGDVYKKKNVGVSIEVQIVQPGGGANVQITWKITEKKQKRNTEDQGFQE